MLLAQMGWESWLIAVVGLLATCLAILLGLRLINRSQRNTKSRPLQITRKFRSNWKGRERRTYQRAQIARVKLLVREKGEGHEPRTALILDRSLGGLAVELQEEVTVGQCLQFRLPEWAPEASWVTVEVRYCRPQGETWRAGCQFLDLSSWEVMNIFGPPDPDDLG